MPITSRFTSAGLVDREERKPFPRPINVGHFREKESRFAAEMLYANLRFSLLGPEDQTTASEKVQLAFHQWLVNHKRTSISNERRKYRFLVQKTLDFIEERAELSRVSETTGVTGVIPFSQPITLVVQPQAIIFPKSRFPFYAAFNSPPIYESCQIPRSSAFPPPSSSIQKDDIQDMPLEGFVFKSADPSSVSFEIMADQEVVSTHAEIWETMQRISFLVNTNQETSLGPTDYLGLEDPHSPMTTVWMSEQ